MASQAEAAKSLAATLLANPGIHQINDLRAEGEWAWSSEGHPGLGGGYIPVYSDVVDNGDEDSTSDPQDIARYAQELEQWFEHEAPSES